MFGSIVVAVSTSLCALLWWFVRRKYSYFKDRGILHNKPTFPLGNIARVKSLDDLYTWGYDEYLKFRGRNVLCGMYLGLQPYLVITDLDLISDILDRDFKYFTDHNNLVQTASKWEDPLGPSLYCLQGEQWRHMRTKMSPAYSSATITDIFEMTQYCASNLSEYVMRCCQTTNGPLNAQDFCLRYLCDSLGSSGFGIDCRGTIDEDPVLLKIAHKVFNPSGTLVMLYTLFYSQIASWFPCYWITKDVRKFIEIIDEIVKYREANNVRRNDILQVWLDVNKRGSVVDDESGEKLGDSEPHGLHAEAYILFFFSYHTTRSSLAATIHELAGNQEIQRRAREEIVRVTAEHEEFNYAVVEKMVYLQQIIDETFRKYPGSGYIERIANADYTVRNGQHRIEKGTRIFISQFGIHHDPDIYPDPLTFNPDRMTSERMRQRHPNSFLPYGVGPRICPADRLVNLQLKLGIISLLSNFQFSLNIRSRIPMEPTISLFKREVWVDVQPL